MLKRFYSKKSGFTLVEIIIAFAIFSIMAAMICQVLDLSVSARRANNVYERELIEQESILAIIDKYSGDFDEEAGKMVFEFTDGTRVELPYAVLSAKPDAEFAAEGLNYFVANVNYGASGDIPVGDDDAGNDVTNNTGSQASRMDTRITGTGGIGYIQITDVIKDENTYAPNDPFAIPEGHTRYFIRCAASSKELDGVDNSLKDEDVPYAQYRLYFYDEEKLNVPASKVVYTDGSGKKYTKDVPATAQIAKVGYLNCYASTAASNGLDSSRVAAGTTANFNKYTVDQMGQNTVRIGSPFKTNNGSNGGMNGKGERFSIGNSTNFYIEFVGDPKITTASFGNNGVLVSSSGTSYNYAACPMYADDYESDGTPKYNAEGKNHVNIYGANLFVRHYDIGGGDSE